MVAVKAIAAILVLVLSSALAAPVTCVGWEMSPSDRRECCQRAHHQHCHDQASADTCCAAHEQGRQAIGASSVPSACGHVDSVSLPAVAFDSVALFYASSRYYSILIAKRLHGPPVLLAPPLRI
jgi:hypothetical protein